MEKKCIQNQYAPHCGSPWPIDQLIRFDVQGEISVSGSSSLNIPCKRMPLIAFAWFGDNAPPPLCGNEQPDFFDLDIRQYGSQWVIHISWSIESGNTRQIFWEAALAGGWFYDLLDWLFG